MLTRQCDNIRFRNIRYQTQNCLRDDVDNNANDHDDSSNDSDMTIIVIDRMQVVIMKFSQRRCLRLEFCWTSNAASLVPVVSKGYSAFI
jgi:hypothetical protein